MIGIKILFRELKSSKKYWAFFVINICIGLIGFTFISLFKSNLTSALDSRAATLLSADLAISGRRALSIDEQKQVNTYLKERTSESTSVRELYSMSRVVNKKKSRLVLVRGVESHFPLRGEVVLEKYGAIDNDLLDRMQREFLTILSPELCFQFGVGIGDSLVLGKKVFKVFDIIKSDSTSSLRGVSLAPKLYIGNNLLGETGLISFGTVAYYSQFYNFKTKDTQVGVKESLFKVISDPAIQVQIPKDASKQLGRVSNYVTSYLSLIGIIALLISSVGGSYLFRSYLLDRLKHIGIMRSVGVSSGQIYLSFILLISLLGFSATLISITGGLLSLSVLKEYLKEWLNFSINIEVSWKLFFTVLSLASFVNLFMILPTMKKVFTTKAADLLNYKYDERFHMKDLVYYLPLIFFVWGICSWQANSFKVGTFFFGIISVSFLVIALILPIMLKFISKQLIGRSIALNSSLSLGFGIRNFSRNIFTTTLLILSLSIGGCLINVIGQLDYMIKSQLLSDTSKAPSLFLFDIQDEQKDELVSFVKGHNIEMDKPTPMVRARLIKKNGKDISRIKDDKYFSTMEDEGRKRFNNRGVNLTFDKGLNSSESLVAGRDFLSVFSEGDELSEISLEKRYAQRLGVKVGDTLTYDILGLEVQASIVNLRSVKWASFLPNFFIKFQPGVLEDAPKTYLSVIKKTDKKRQLEIQNIIVEKFPLISIVDVTDTIEKALGLFTAIGNAVGFMSFCCIGVGIFVLFSILQSQMFKKAQEFALQKINGMSEKQIFYTILWEYLMTISVALFFSLSFGIGVSYLVSQMFLDGAFLIHGAFIGFFIMSLLILSLGVILITFKINYTKRIANLLG